MSDPLDMAPEMVPFVTGEELLAAAEYWPWRVLTKDEELRLVGQAAHSTIGGRGTIARLRERRRLERVKR